VNTHKDKVKTQLDLLREGVKQMMVQAEESKFVAYGADATSGSEEGRDMLILESSSSSGGSSSSSSCGNSSASTTYNNEFM
jgi:hypothetical protein